MSKIGKWAGAMAIVAGIATAGWDVGSSTSQVPSTASGAALFAAKGCAACHTGPDSVATFGEFPPLDDALAWAGTRRQGTSGAGYLTESIVAPQAFISPRFEGGAGPTTGMPQLRISPAEVDALVEYLTTSS